MRTRKRTSGRSASSTRKASASALASKSTVRTKQGKIMQNPAAGGSDKRPAGSGGAVKRPASRSAAPSEPEVAELAATQPLSLVKARFSEMVERVNAYQDRITVTKNGVPVAVLLSADDFESLVETIEILTDPEAMAQIAEGQADVERGDVVTGEELARRYGLELR